MQEYEDQIKLTEERLRDAKDRRAEAEVKELKERLGELKEGYNEARDREMPRHSTGMMAGGIVLLSVGGLGILTGAVLGLTATSPDGGPNLTAPAIALLVGGVACAGVGIPLVYIGSKRERKSLSSSSARPTLLVSPGGVGLRVQF